MMHLIFEMALLQESRGRKLARDGVSGKLDPHHSQPIGAAASMAVIPERWRQKN
jgi:hypothetical protein